MSMPCFDKSLESMVELDLAKDILEATLVSKSLAKESKVLCFFLVALSA